MKQTLQTFIQNKNIFTHLHYFIKNAATADICQIRFFIYQNPCLWAGVSILHVTDKGGIILGSGKNIGVF